MNCAYLANHHPQERRKMELLRLKAAQAVSINVPKKSVHGILNKVFYNSGKLIGSIKKGL